MSKKLTNEEVYKQIAAMNEAEAAQYGVTPAVRSVAQQSDSVRANAFSAPYTPLYNAFVGMIAKFAVTALSKAKYDDIYSRHHRNYAQGRPQIGFVKTATAGTGNDSALFSSTPKLGSLTSLVTADQPEVITLYDTVNKSFVARVPISPEDVKNAVTSEYGISELITKTREAAEDKIINDRNTLFDEQLLASAQTAILAGTGSEVNANAALATKVLLPLAPHTVNKVVDGVMVFTDEDLSRVYTEIKKVYFALTGRPVTTYNALGVANNVEKSNCVCYIDSDLLAEMETRVAQAAYNLDKLEQSGLVLVPTKAPYLGKSVTTGASKFVPLVVIGSADYIRDYPISDYTSDIQVDRGTIHSRFFDDQLIKAGYEPFVFLGAETDSVRTMVNSAAAGFNFIADGVPVESEGLYLTLKRPASSVVVKVNAEKAVMVWRVGTVEVLRSSNAPVGTEYDVTDVFNSTTATTGTIDSI